MKKIHKLFKKDRFGELCGIEIDEIKEGYAKTSITITKSHLNGLDMTQGGLIYTLADVAFAAAANSYGEKAVGLSTNISYFRKTTEGAKLEAIANVISKTKRTCNVDIIVNCNNVMIAKMNAVAFIKNESV